MRKLSAMLTILVLTLCATPLMMAQSLGGARLSGVVSDKSGAVIGQTKVTARNVATGLVSQTASNESGYYVFATLPVGVYELEAKHEGFATSKAKVQLSVGAQVELALQLSVGGADTKVEVTGEAPLIETTRSEMSSTVNQKSIENLPVLGRNFTDFVLLTPGVTRDTRTGDISFAGQRGTLNSMTVDGGDNNNSFYGQTASRSGFKTPYQFSQDAVQEFQVATNGFSAALGRSGGSVINVVTKSGTNKLHGDLFEYYRDQSLNAYDAMQKQNAAIVGKVPTAKAKYHYNQFGGSLGGPIWRDRAFFFVNVDDQRNTLPNIITPLAAPASTATTEQMTAYNYLLKRAGNYNKLNNQNTYLMKFDAALSQRNMLSARWNRQRFTAGSQENAGATSSLEHTGDSYIHTDTLAISLTSTLSSTLNNQLRFNYLRDREPGSTNSSNAEATVKQSGTTLLAVGRNDFSPRETTIRQEQYSDTLTWVAGKNTLAVGADAVVAKIKNYFPGNFFGNYTFNSLQDFGCSLLNEAPGTKGCGAPTYLQAFGGAGTSGAETHPDTFEPDWFVQDDYKLLHNLKINAGLRWDHQGVRQSGVQNAAALALGFDTSKQQIKDNEWQPRFGFAWDVLSNSRLVVRGGYGLFYGVTNSMLLGTAMSNNGINVATYTFSAAATPFYADARPTSPAGLTPAPAIYVVGKNFQNPMVQQGNLGAEYAVSNSLSVSATYLHAKGDHIQRTGDVNLGAPVSSTIIDPATGSAINFLRYTARKYSNFSRISLFTSDASSNYNGLALEAKKRFSQSLQGTLSYTWSHAIDDAPDATSVVPGNAGDDAKVAMYPTNPSFDRGDAGSDIRHRLAASYVWQPSFTKDYGKLVNALINHWQMSGILTAQSGLAYSKMVSGDMLNDGNSYNVRLPGTNRNSFRMPATWQYDTRIGRDIPVRWQGVKVQLFAEAFNLFNHANINGVKTNDYSYTAATNTLKLLNPTNAPTSYFGLTSSVMGQRVIQLGAKIVF